MKIEWPLILVVAIIMGIVIFAWTRDTHTNSEYEWLEHKYDLMVDSFQTQKRIASEAQERSDSLYKLWEGTEVVEVENIIKKKHEKRISIVMDQSIDNTISDLSGWVNDIP